MTEYEPGVCNIGPAERRKRYGLGAVSFAAALVVVVGVYALGLPSVYLLATFPPLFGVAEGYLQGRYRFCAGFAMLGVYDVSDAGGDRRAVEDPAAVRADRRRALVVHGQALGLALAGAAVVYGVGVLAT